MSADEVLTNLQKQAQESLDKEKGEEQAAEKRVSDLADLQKQFVEEREGFGKAKYDEGVKAGLEQAGKSASDPVFSHEDLDAKVKEAVDPLQKQLDELKTASEGSKSEVDRLNKMLEDQKADFDKRASEESIRTGKIVADLKGRIAAQIRSVDISNEAVAKQLEAEAAAPSAIVDDQGAPVIEEPKKDDAPVAEPVPADPAPVDPAVDPSTSPKVEGEAPQDQVITPSPASLDEPAAAVEPEAEHGDDTPIAPVDPE